MLNTTDREDVTGDRSVGAIAMIYMILTLLLIPLGLVFIGGTLLSKLKRLRGATDPCERMYWRLNVIACLLLAYGFMVLGLLMFDSMRGDPWKLAEGWPSVGRSLRGAKNDGLAILMDIMAVLAAAFAFLCTSRRFGRLDENEAWCPPERMSNKRCGDATMEEAPGMHSMPVSRADHAPGGGARSS